MFSLDNSGKNSVNIKCTYILARHSIYGYMRGMSWMGGVVGGVRGRNQRRVRSEPGGRVRCMVVVMQLGVVVECRHAVHAGAAAVDAGAIAPSAATAYAARVYTAYGHCRLEHCIL